MDKTPAGDQDQMYELLEQVLETDSQQEAQRRLEEASGELEKEAEAAVEILEEGLFDTTAVLALPEKYRERLRTSNMLERLIQEIRIRIFPNEASAWRLV
ncbi:MAG: transposase [Candidatus Aenigmatarchaeota archaeon]